MAGYCVPIIGSIFCRDPVLAPDPGLCISNEGRFLKDYLMNILDNFFKAYFLLSYYLDPDPVRILPDSDWFSKSRTSMVRLTPKYENI